MTTTLESRVAKKKETLQRILPELKAVMHRPMGKLSGKNSQSEQSKAFDQWTQGFNQYGK
jgi:hypothetical protein